MVVYPRDLCIWLVDYVLVTKRLGTHVLIFGWKNGDRFTSCVDPEEII